VVRTRHPNLTFFLLPRHVPIIFRVWQCVDAARGWHYAQQTFTADDVDNQEITRLACLTIFQFPSSQKARL
jgi:hypothetical protein